MAQYPAIVCFAKNPELVPVKTRLAKSIGAEKACLLYKAMVHDCLDNLANLTGTSLYLACFPDSNHDFFHDLAARSNARLFDQEGQDLGERMLNCIRTLSAKHPAVVICGSDLPSIPLRKLCDSLIDFQSWDILIGPSPDGGYYLIGMKEPLEIFEGVRWSTPDVLKQTLANADQYTIKMLEERADIDDLESLSRFIKDLADTPGLAPFTRQVVCELKLMG